MLAVVSALSKKLVRDDISINIKFSSFWCVPALATSALPLLPEIVPHLSYCYTYIYGKTKKSLITSFQFLITNILLHACHKHAGEMPCCCCYRAVVATPLPLFEFVCTLVLCAWLWYICIIEVSVLFSFVAVVNCIGWEACSP